MSFTLKIKNVPGGSVRWSGSYGTITSGWLDIDEIWVCPYGAYGTTDLTILVMDSAWDYRHQESGLGPIYDGGNYIYDCASRDFLEGTIASKELRFDSITKDIPVSDDIEAGVYEGLVVIRGRNDTSHNRKMGVHWTVKDPDGWVVTNGEYTRWENTWTGPGLEQPFIDFGGAFALNKEGDYTIEIELLMNYGDPVVVDSYNGLLCTVMEEAPPPPPPEYKGTITEKTLHYDTSDDPVPVSDIHLGRRCGLYVEGANDMATTQQMGIRWKIKDPDGDVVDSYEAWEAWPYCPPGEAHRFYHSGGLFDIDKVGIYTLELDLLMNRGDEEIVDDYRGTLCSTIGELPPEYTLIQHTIYPFSYIYSGEVEVVTATFKTDPFTPSAWMGEQFAKKLDEEYRARGGRVLEVRVYVDVSPLLWTNYRIELVGTTLGEEVEAAAVGVAGIPIAIAVLIIALAIIAVIVVATLMWERFQASFEHKPGLEEVKPAWGKETLILAIQDAEEYWGRPVTPPGTLGGMSEEDLRVLLDQIAEEEVPSEVSWLPLAVVGGIVIVGVGVTVAVVSSNRKGKP
jgi:hypothetical protein